MSQYNAYNQKYYYDDSSFKDHTEHTISDNSKLISSERLTTVNSSSA